MLSVIRNLFRVNLGIKKDERCIVFFDRPSPREVMDSREEERRSRLPCVAFLAAETGKGFAKEVILHEYASTGTHGAEPPSELWEKAFGRRAVAAMDKHGVFLPLLE